MSLITEEKYIHWPSAAYRQLMRDSWLERMNANRRLVTARKLPWGKVRLGLGVSESYYRFYFMHHFIGVYGRFMNLSVEGVDQVPLSGPRVYVMKHRKWCDITFHGVGHALITSGLKPPDIIDPRDHATWRRQAALTETCRFVMKGELLTLPVGAHMLMNGAIPITQDMEIKKRNTPGYEPSAKEVRLAESLKKWYSFMDSYREITDTLKSGKSIIIYGESTRVKDGKMGHLSTAFLKKLERIPGCQFIPVGTSIQGRNYQLRYGPPCKVEELREHVANLSHIDQSDWLN